MSGPGIFVERNIVALVSVVVIASVLIGTAAFTSGSVDRAATVNVVGDDAALTGLAPGDSSVVQYDGNNQLVIDYGQATNADGINANSTYTVGDGANANTSYAFNITNNDNNAHDYTLGYDFDSGAAPGNSSVTYTVYDSSGTKLVEATGTSDSNSFNLASTETAYVVMTVNADGTDPTDDLSGSLIITVS